MELTPFPKIERRGGLTPFPSSKIPFPKEPMKKEEEPGVLDTIWNIAGNAASEVGNWAKNTYNQFGRVRAADLADTMDSLPSLGLSGDTVRQQYANSGIPLGSYSEETNRQYEENIAPVAMGVGLIPTPVTRAIGVAALPYVAKMGKEAYDQNTANGESALYGVAKTAKDFTWTPAADLAHQIYDSPESRRQLWESFKERPIETGAGAVMAGLGLYGLGKGIKGGAKGLAYAQENPQMLNPLHRYEVSKNAEQIQNDYYQKKKKAADDARIDDIIRQIKEGDYYRKKAALEHNANLGKMYQDYQNGIEAETRQMRGENEQAQRQRDKELGDLLGRIVNSNRDYGAFERGEVAETPIYGEARQPRGANTEEQIWNWLKSEGFTDEGAAGIMGNFRQEAGADFATNAVENGGRGFQVDGATGYGLAQWTDAGRQQGLLDMAKQMGSDVSDINVQLAYLKKEMQDYGIWDKVKNSQDIREATKTFHDEYENSNDYNRFGNIEHRHDFANEYYGKYRGQGGEVRQERLPTYEQKHYTVSDQVSDAGLTDLTEQKLNALAHDFEERFGEKLYITSMKRNGDGSSWHDSGQAVDIAGGILEHDQAARDWLMERGKQYGLVGLDEYTNPSPHATGGHIHFSDHGDMPTGTRTAIGGSAKGRMGTTNRTPQQSYGDDAGAGRVGEITDITGRKNIDPEIDSYNTWVKANAPREQEKAEGQATQDLIDREAVRIKQRAEAEEQRANQQVPPEEVNDSRQAARAEGTTAPTQQSAWGESDGSIGDNIINTARQRIEKNQSDNITGIATMLDDLKQQRQTLLDEVKNYVSNYKGKGAERTTLWDADEGRIIGRVAVSNNDLWYQNHLRNFKNPPRKNQINSPEFIRDVANEMEGYGEELRDLDDNIKYLEDMLERAKNDPLAGYNDLTKGLYETGGERNLAEAIKEREAREVQERQPINQEEKPQAEARVAEQQEQPTNEQAKNAVGRDMVDDLVNGTKSRMQSADTARGNVERVATSPNDIKTTAGERIGDIKNLPEPRQEKINEREAEIQERKEIIQDNKETIPPQGEVATKSEESFDKDSVEELTQAIKARAEAARQKRLARKNAKATAQQHAVEQAKEVNPTNPTNPTEVPKPLENSVEELTQTVADRAEVEIPTLPKRRAGRPSKKEQAERKKLEEEIERRKQEQKETARRETEKQGREERKQIIDDEMDSLYTDIAGEAAKIVNRKLKAAGVSDKKLAAFKSQKNGALYDQAVGEQIEKMLDAPRGYGGKKHEGEISEKLERYNELQDERAVIEKEEIAELREKNRADKQVAESKAKQTAKLKRQKSIDIPLNNKNTHLLDDIEPTDAELKAIEAEPKTTNKSVTPPQSKNTSKLTRLTREGLDKRIEQEIAVTEAMLEEGEKPSWYKAYEKEYGEPPDVSEWRDLIKGYLRDEDPRYRRNADYANMEHDGILYNRKGEESTGSRIDTEEAPTLNRDRFGHKEGTGKYEGDTVTQNQIFDRARELFGVIHQGGMPDTKTLGYFNTKSGAMRIAKWGGKAQGMAKEWSSMFHEIGHKIDGALKLEKEFSTEAKAELGKIMQELYGNKIPYDLTPQTIFSEGFANFLAEFICDNEGAMRHKKMYDEFGSILARDTDLAARVYEMQQMMDVKAKQPLAAEIAGAITSKNDVKPKTWKEKLKSVFDRVLTEADSRRKPLSKIDDLMKKALGRDLTPDESIEVAASLSKAKGLAAAQTLLEGRNANSVLETLKAERPDIEFKGASLRMAVDKVKELETKHGDWLTKNKVTAEQAVNSYLLAKHFDEVYRTKYEKPLALLEGNMHDAWADMNEAKIQAKEQIDAARDKWREAEKQISEVYPDGKTAVRQAVREARKAREEYLKTKDKAEREVAAKEKAAKEAKKLWENKRDRGYDMPKDISQYREFLEMDMPQEVKSAAQILWDVNDNLLTLLEHGGVISKETAAKFRKDYPHYCSLAREFPNDVAKCDDAIVKHFGGKEGFMNVGKAFETLSEEGSTRNVMNPIETYADNIMKVTSMIERNNVGKKIVKAANDLAMPEIADKKLKGGASAKESSFYVYEDGQKVVYSTTPEIYSAMQDFTPQGMYKVVDSVLRIPAQWLRVGSTGANLAFAPINFLRDNLSAWAFSGGEYTPLLDAPLKEAFRGIWHDKYGYGKGSKLWNEYKASGAQMAGEIHVFEDFKTDVLDPLREANNKWHKKPGQVIDLLKNINDVWEQATRMGLYQKRLKSGGSRVSAGYSARSNTLDFGRGGRAVMIANRYIPFLNAGIQGTSLLARRLANPKTRAATLWRGGMVAVASLALHAMIRSDDDYSRDYDEAPDYQKDMFWLVPTGKDKNGKTSWLRLPKDFGFGMIFASLPTRGVDYAMGYDKDALTEWGDRFLRDNVTQFVNPVDLVTKVQAFKPIWELTANYDSFRKRDIVPDYMRQFEAKDQYDKSTSNFAKKVGETFNLSPKKIDYAGQSFFGGLYNQTLGNSNPASDLVRRFDYDPEASPRSSQRYYERRDTLQKAHASRTKTGRRMSIEDRRDYKILKSFESRLKTLNDKIKRAERAGSEERAEQLRGYRRKLLQQGDKAFNKKGA